MTRVEENEDGSVTFNCPVCNRLLFNFGDPVDVEPCKHVLLYYSDTVDDEFCYVAKSMKKVADKIMKQFDECNTIPDLMEEYAKKNKNIEIFSITTSGMSCGPCSSTDLIMIQMKEPKKAKKSKKP